MIQNLSSIKKYLLAALVQILVLAGATSCSNSGVPCEEVSIPVTFTIHHDQEWTDTVYYPDGFMARSGKEVPGVKLRYCLRAYPKGKTSGKCYTYEFYHNDVSLADFNYTLKLPMGEWDIYAWQDMETAGQEPYYDIANFAAISYISPYRGNTDHRDCFRGVASVSVPPSALSDGKVDGGILNLDRPAGKYVFIANDYDKFVQEQMNKKSPVDNVRVVAIYSTFMPSVFNNFTNLIADSEPGVRYEAEIEPLGNGRAMIAMDYVLLNSRESGVQVQLAMRDSDGKLVALTEVLTVPLVRGRITYVEGDFLTTSDNSGIIIDFGFDGDINIKI